MTFRLHWLLPAAWLAVAACAGHRPKAGAAAMPDDRASKHAGADSAVSPRPATQSAAVHVARETPAGRRSAGATRPDRESSARELKSQAVRVFGDSIVQQGTPRGSADELEANDGDGTAEMDVDTYLSQERVEHYIARFSGPARAYVESRLERGSRYEPMIRRMLREGGLPEDLYYLALVESGYNPHAYSRAAAVGMWQFMTSTAKGMGLRVDWWVDERRDPVRSTAAAVRFIRGLRAQFGSLYLAAAAYNGGPGRIARGLSRYAGELDGVEGEDVFFRLAEKDYLARETKEYVPQLIAAALVARTPERYGLTLKTLPPFEYDSVLVPAETPLAAIAKAADTTVDAIKEFNPQLLRGVTPPKRTTLVRLPVGKGESFEEALAALPAEEREGLRRVVSKQNDTWERIAAREDISAAVLVRYNPEARRTRRGRLLPGQRLIVPTAAVAAAALDVPDPSVERYASGTRGRVLHTVRPGETLSHIARRYRTTTATLMRINGLRKPMIFPGQSLLVSGKSAAAKRSSVRRAKGAARSRGGSKARGRSVEAKRGSAARIGQSSSRRASSSATGSSSSD